MGSLLNGIARNYADFRAFGAGFPLRHLTKAAHRPIQLDDTPNEGRVHLRCGSTDAAVFRQVFQSREYHLSSHRRYPDIAAHYTQWLDATKVMIIEFHDRMMPGRGTSFALQRAMAARRFKVLISGENLVYYNIDAGQSSV